MYATKISGDTTNTLNCYFFFKKKITLWHIRLNINIWKTKFSSHKQYLFDLLLPRTAKKTHTDQSIYKLSCTVWKKKISQTFKSSSCKKVFPKSVYHWDNLFQWMFLLHVITRIFYTNYFLHKFIVAQSFGTTAMLLRSLK